ncbi:MAG: hypothetical protein KJO82_05900 [Gammaproteobacteria bacterium]|nr:hypothetical protein [Gammaproteobacteria bacterium]
MPAVLDLDAIKPLIDIPQLIGEIEVGFELYSKGQAMIPPVGFLHFDEPPGDVHIKYGAIPGDDYFVLKVASSFYKNPDLGLAASDGSILVFSQTTGELQLVLLDKCWLTDMRTAAAGAVAAKHLAAKKVDCIGIVGTGVQARLQLELLRHVVDCRRCLVWGRDSAKAQTMIEDVRASEGIEGWDLEIDAADTVENLVSQCKLIVTTTPARKPLIHAGWVQKGTHITAMGSDDHGKQELESSLLAKADLVVADSISQCVDHGECHSAERDGQIEKGGILELGNVISNPGIGRTSEEQITVADLTGIAIQDIQIAKMVDRGFRAKPETARRA